MGTLRVSIAYFFVSVDHNFLFLPASHNFFSGHFGRCIVANLDLGDLLKVPILTILCLFFFVYLTAWNSL